MRLPTTGGRLIIVAFLAALLGPAFAQNRTFAGFQCTDNCVGHAVGYQWASNRVVTQEGQCRPRNGSRAFREGCLAYIREPTRGAGLDDAGELILPHQGRRR
jgi:hypothetical protein